MSATKQPDRKPVGACPLTFFGAHIASPLFEGSPDAVKVVFESAPCRRDICEWWSKHHRSCVVVVIAEKLGALAHPDI